MDVRRHATRCPARSCGHRLCGVRRAGRWFMRSEDVPEPGRGEIVYQHNNYEPGDENELYQKVKQAAGK